MEAAYNVGFQTQAPIQTVFWSDGPTREFSVGNARVFIRHVSDGKLRWVGATLGNAIKSYGSHKSQLHLSWHYKNSA